MYGEILKLKRLLEMAEIPFQFRPWLKGYQIGYPVLAEDKRICSVVEFPYSYGAEKDLLEIMGLLTDEEKEYNTVKGWLSATEVFHRINDDFKQRY